MHLRQRRDRGKRRYCSVHSYCGYLNVSLFYGWNSSIVKDKSSLLILSVRFYFWSLFSLSSTALISLFPLTPLPVFPLSLSLSSSLPLHRRLLFTTLSDMIIFFFLQRGQWRERHSKPTSHVLSCLRQNMKGHHGDMSICSQRGRARADGQLEGVACFQTKNTSLWRLTQSKMLITSWVAIRASSRQRKQRQGHSVMLHSGIIIWTVRSDYCVAAYFHWSLMSILSCRHTEQKESKTC